MTQKFKISQAPAGLNATGDSDIRFFYDQVKVEQEHTLRPQLQRLVEILLACRANQSSFSITFPALWQDTEQEKANLRKTQADIDAIYLANQVVLPEEVALNRFGSGSFSSETVIDIEGRKGILESEVSSG